MTLPNRFYFRELKRNVGEQDPKEFTDDLIDDLGEMYEDLAQAVNGTTLWNDGEASQDYTPTVAGTSAAGTADYIKQVGWAHRTGNMVDIWFDVEWSNHTGTGNMYVTLPYLVLSVDGGPFVGQVQADNITIAGTGLVGNAIPETRRYEIWENVSGGPSVNIAIPAAGRLCGTVRYIGESNEVERLP